ncbi:hypothetical protein [Sphingomonas sp. BGYR3]|uniref:hypothetical protein n=1 Tax=Sphingomonas sp. BGYR3 TaxID=2975483 RepID=UPI00325F9563
MGGLAAKRDCDLFYLCSISEAVALPGDSNDLETVMQHDASLRAAARAIYDACFPTEELAPVGFDDAERYGTIHYRRAIEAAQLAKPHLAHDRSAQPSLF